MSLTNAHRLFLQSFMSHGLKSAKQVRDLHNLIKTRYPDEELGNLVEIVNAINEQTKHINIVIKKCTSEETGAHFYGLVNTANTEITRSGTDYTKSELEIFKRIIEEIVTSEHGYVSSIDLLNMTIHIFQDKRVTKKEIENLIEKLEQDNWLTNNGGDVSMSTRSLLELSLYIKEKFVEIPNCEMCSEICLKGQRCTSCDVKLHFHCGKKYFTGKQAPKCPGKNCQVPWPHSVSAEPASQQPTSSPERPSRKRALRE